MPTILAVDDKRDNVDLLAQILEADYDVVTGFSGAECLQRAKADSPDLILLDVQMPEMDGYETLQHLQEDEHTRDIPVIFVTARYRDSDRIVRGLDSGAFDYISKPVDDEVVAAKVRLALRVKSAEEKICASAKELKEARDELDQRVQQRTADLEETNNRLCASEAKYRDLYNNAPDMYVSVDAVTGKILQCNQTLADTTGYTRDEIIGRQIFEMYHPDSMKDVKEAFQSFVTTGEVHNANLKLKCKNGRKIDVSLNVTAVRDEQGNITRSRSVLRDTSQQDYQVKLRHLASQLASAEESERHRIAEKLHDEIGQDLVISKLKIDEVRSNLPPGDDVRQLSHVSTMLDHSINRVHSLTFDLGSPILYELGLEAAMKELLIELFEKTNIKSEFAGGGLQPVLDDSLTVFLYQAVREFLVNVLKHAQASQVKVFLQEETDRILVTVEDNGKGFSADDDMQLSRERGFGLFSIEERLKNIDGKIEINSQPGAGTCIGVSIPRILRTGAKKP